MVRISIDLKDSVADFFDKKSESNKRSRKAEIEKFLEDSYEKLESVQA